MYMALKKKPHDSELKYRLAIIVYYNLCNKIAKTTSYIYFDIYEFDFSIFTGQFLYVLKKETSNRKYNRISISHQITCRNICIFLTHYLTCKIICISLTHYLTCRIICIFLIHYITCIVICISLTHYLNCILMCTSATHYLTCILISISLTHYLNCILICISATHYLIVLWFGISNSLSDLQHTI